MESASHINVVEKSVEDGVGRSWCRSVVPRVHLDPLWAVMSVHGILPVAGVDSEH